MFEKFGSRVAVTVLSLSKDKGLPKKPREQTYCKQLREASIDAKIIKLCDISANLSSLKSNEVSKSKKTTACKTYETVHDDNQRRFNEKQGGVSTDNNIVGKH
ncbi:MAG: hypothetical protein ACR2LL_13375 [Nitrosopumilus sp.]